ncbi:hypothetical protein LTR78_005341 [Recurvomyces mirabilis]|uniref:Uncharacterized protein n=1 Tax=Recurvomyces mirabilis TaxID=574656 RepID=A0AAE0WMZ2_9PEZI|nr:hypothetical protein LTR78_005341 [Recurvomyces mirabilis]KAK5152752.1 hypothetical protein LTS14_008286 [Recurvomyces mirabilis]
MADDKHPEFKYYEYDPSIAAACTFAVIFGLLTTWHMLLIVKHKTWYFIPLIVGGLFEFGGYVSRAVSHGQGLHQTLVPYVVQTLLLLVAPPLFAATTYMFLGHLIVGLDREAHSLIKKRWLAKTFVTSDIICFIIQLGGAGLMASSTSSTAATGSHIILAGLLLQIVIFGLFVAVAWMFQRKMIGAPNSSSDRSTPHWTVYMRVLYATSAFILARNIVRVAEFILGFHGYILLHEVFLYVFDAVPMAAFVATYAVLYPTAFSTYARAAEMKEMPSRRA